MKYRHFGSSAITETVEGTLKKFGQDIELSDSVALDVIDCGGAILTPAMWDEVGFTPAEKSDRRARREKVFYERNMKALSLMAELRKQIAERLAPPAPTVEPIHEEVAETAAAVPEA
jgi:hypothetical protein